MSDNKPADVENKAWSSGVQHLVAGKNPSPIENKVVLAAPNSPAGVNKVLTEHAAAGFKLVAVSQLIDGVFWMFLTKDGTAPGVHQGGGPIVAKAGEMPPTSDRGGSPFVHPAGEHPR